ncbi:MAG TPA: hydroxyethylthiazole kinase, partial [Longimicrobiaceae bacterium]|nr:hydroxyethylthiazole kinase [Longimicrobiaceae bacterium]
MDNANTWSTLRELRRAAPLVHSITNYVAMDVTANALLAIGASPAMVHAIEEVEEFVAISSALVVNIGTLSPTWVDSMTRAARHANALGKPWVLDPVGSGATSYRTLVSRELARLHPTVLRGNASEILAVAGGEARTKGVDSVHGSEQALGVARELAAELGCVVAVTGEVDVVSDGARVLRVENGHPMMTKVTALGCAATALTGAFLAVQPDPLLASAQALGVLGLCGEIAARAADGPGSLRWRLLDALYNLDEAAVLRGLRIREG